MTQVLIPKNHTIYVTIIEISESIQFSSFAQLCPTLCDPMDCRTPGFPVHHQSLLKLMSIELVMPSDHFILCHPLLLLPSIFPSIRAFSQYVGSSHQVAKVLGISASAWVLPMNILDWFPLAWTVWISLQSKGLSRVFSNTTVQKHQFFGVQLYSSRLLEKPKLMRQTFVGKVMSLLFNMLSSLVMAFLPRSKLLLILWLQSPSAVILEPQK